MNRKHSRGIILLLTVLWAGPVLAQTGPGTGPVIQSADTMDVASFAGPRESAAPSDTLRPGGLPVERGFFGSPTGTLLKSVAFPGWGQWSNGKKQKAAIYFGVETYFFSRALVWRHRTAGRLRTWETLNNCVGDNCDVVALSGAFDSYDSARDRRNYFYWLTGFTVFVSMFDAYADAYLLSLERTRDKGDDFWGGRTAYFPPDEYRLSVNWRF